MLHFLYLIFCVSPGLGMPDMMQQNKYIIGGQNTNITEVPYTAALYRHKKFVCGATVVSEKYLLTAAHCIIPISEYYVRVGSSFREQGGVIHKVKKIVKHPLYASNALDYDAACLEVEDPIEFNSNVQPIPVTDVEPKGGEIAKISGYGRNGNVTLPKQLQSAELIVLDKKKCSETYSGITQRMICTVSKDYDKCAYKGDSGGPIVINGKVAGAVSWGRLLTPCKYPTVYANFGDPELRQFIRENTGV